jgi:hypothetical protein
MQVNNTGRQSQSVRINFLDTSAKPSAELSDLPSVYRNVTPLCRISCAIDNLGITNDQVVHEYHLYYV